MTTTDEKLDSSPPAPSHQDAAGEPLAAPEPVSESVQVLLDAFDDFLGLQSQRLAPLAELLRTGSAQHDTALARLEGELPKVIERPWSEVANYIAQVQRAVIEPLRSEMARLDLVGGGLAQWNETGAPAQPAIAALSRKDQQALSPLIPLWRATATVFSHIESGVAQWTRATLDAASALDCLPLHMGARGGAGAGVADSTEPALDSDVVFAAGGQLSERLLSAIGQLASITTIVRDQLAETAAGKSGRLDAAFATGKEEVVADDTPLSATGEESADIWGAWFEQANARIDLAAARLSAYAALADMHIGLLRDIDENSLGAWREGARGVIGTIGEIRGRAEDIYRQLAETGDGRLAIREAKELFNSANRSFYQDYVCHVDPARVKRFVVERSATALTQITALAGQLPEGFSVHPIPENPDGAVVPPMESRRVTLRPVALTALETTLAPALSATTGSLSQFGETMTDEIANVHSVLRFHLSAAVEELREVSWVRGAKEQREQAIAAARELTLAGLDRVIEALAQHQIQIDTCLRDVSQALTDARHTIWQTVGSQVQAETATQQLALKTRSTVVTSIQSFRHRLAAAARRLVEASGRQTLVLYRKLQEILHYGRSAVIGGTTPIDKDTSIDAIARLGDIRASLPTVYRRLFSFYPLSDETLMAGRDEDILWLQNQIRLWRSGRSNAYVLTSTPGCGLTSFLNVAKQKCFHGAVVAEIDLVQRVTHEAELVKQLMKALAVDTDTDPPQTLAALADRIMSGEDTGQLAVGILEHLGHVFIRRIGGMALLGRLLRFLSETDSRIFWVATMNDFAWQLLAKNEPLALGLVTRYRVSDYNRASLEDVIIRRHRRSGLPITFDPPAVVSPFLRRRLSKAAGEDEKQTLLRSQFFDDLFSAGGQNIMLGLFYWHLSIAHHSEPASIQVRALPKLSFDFLTLLSLPETFALKAFLEHATLTVCEYAEIANVDLDSSIEIFESLGNSMIIEPVADDERNISGVDFDRVQRQYRYRIRPLLIQPVIRYLRAKNIAH